MTLTGCIVHGFGVYFFLGDEGMPTGSNWTLECALWLQTSCRSLGGCSIVVPAHHHVQAMRSIDHAWAKARASGLQFPLESGTQYWRVLLVIGIFKSFNVLRLWLQGDNCPKEVRNSFIGKWGSLLLTVSKRETRPPERTSSDRQLKDSRGKGCDIL